MFRFKKIKIQNFMSIEEAELDLEKRGLVLIEGKNETNPTFQSNGSGKCVSGDSEIYSVMKGRKVPLKEFVHDRETKTLGITDTYRTTEVEVTDWHELGIREMMKITTDMGEEIVTAGTHPFLTPRGTEKAEDLKEGDFVAVTRFLPLGEGAGLSSKFLYSLGALIGDGGMTHGNSISFTNMEQEIFDAVEEGIQEEFPDIYFSHDYDRRAKTKSMTRDLLSGGVRRDTHPFYELIKSLGLRTLSKEKDIPQDLMGRLNREQVISLLSGLYNTDGEIPNIKNKNPRRTITYTTASKRLAYKVKDLWLMLGIPVSVRPRKVKGRGDQLYWRVTTYSNTWDDIVKNLKLVGEPRDRLRDVDLYFKNKYGGMTPRNNNDVIPPHFNRMLETTPAVEYSLPSGRKPHRTRKQLDTKSFSREIYGKWAGNNILSESDVTWVKIDSITKEPPEYCYDITVDNDNHLYMADNFIVHNSSLLSSITYALYGQTPSGLKADDVINRKVGKNTSVKLFFDVDGQSYRVERYRKHSKQKNLVKLFQGNTELTGKSMRDTDKKIQDIFGIDYNTYMNSIVQGQGEAEVFSQATDKGKKEILENITNIAIYKKAQEIAKEKVKETSSELGDIQRDIETINRDLESTKERQEEERSSYQHTIDSINETKENLENLLQELEEAKSSYPKDLKRNINRLHKLEAPTYPQMDFTTDDFIKEQEAMITSIENFLTSEVDRVKSEGSSEIQTLKEQKENITTQVQPILTELNVLTNEIDNHKRDIEQLDFAVECPVCGNPLDASHAQKENERLQSLINQKQEKVDFTSNIYTNELVPMLDNMDKQIQEKEQEISNNVKEFEKSAKIQLKGVEQDISYYKSDKEAEIRQGFEQEQAIYQGKMREKDQLISEQNRLDNNISGLEQQIKSEKSILKRLEGLPKPKDFTEDIKAFEEELQNLNIELLAKTDKIDKYENVVQLYSNTGVRSVVLDLVTPFLNEKANKYMKTLSGSDIEILFTTQTENKDGSLSDKFDIEINNSSGGDTYQSNSEGEKKRIDLAISFAIQDLVLSKNNMQTNLAIYDECFEGLDEVGSENVIKLLRERLDKLETIFVITHNDHLKTLFEQVVTVQKIDGLSKIIES